MVLFREGLRQMPAMRELLAPMQDRDLEDIAAHFSRLPARAPDTPRSDALFARGAALAAQMSCGGCHLPDYSGRDQMPRLAGQRQDYLFETMVAYRDNRRAGADTTMTGILRGAPDADLQALAHFLAHFR
jgi:cytochrome c553